MKTTPILSTLLAAAVAASFSTVQAATLDTERYSIEVNALVDGLANPWGMAFLPDSSLLITEKGGALKHVKFDGTTRTLNGVPNVVAVGQGGLLDVALDPDFSENKLVYLSYSEADPAGGDGNSTAVARGQLGDEGLENVEVIFRGAPKYNSRQHFGSRLVFSPEGHLYITLGDRGSRMQDAQTLDNHHGKVVRIWPDGGIPEDNPFVDTEGALPEIWSYGHRNVQGAVLHPDSGVLWTVEHGPKGGDEINIPVAGNNYGWPVATYGVNYDNSIITRETHKEGTEQPFYYWVPSIATSNMMFYTGDAFPQWQGDLFVGALRGQQVARLDMEDGRIMHEEALLTDSVGRIRDIEQGPDGYIYVITDDRNGSLIQIKPAE